MVFANFLKVFYSCLAFSFTKIIAALSPSTDISRTTHEYYLRPLLLDIDQNKENHEESESEARNFYGQERYYRDIQRSIFLPCIVKATDKDIHLIMVSYIIKFLTRNMNKFLRRIL